MDRTNIKERGKIPSVTLALWVPMLWYALMASRSVGRWMHDLTGIGDIKTLEGSPINRAVFGALMATGLLILARRAVNWSRMVRVNRWILLFFVYVALSILWSEFRGAAFARLAWMFGFLIMALVVLTEPNPIEAISTLFRRCFYIFLPLSIVLISYYPELGIRNEKWVGAMTHKNGLGQVAVVSVIYFLWKIVMYDNKRRVVAVNLVFLSMGLWLLVGSDSMTSIFVFAIGTLILFTLRLLRNSAMSAGKQVFVGALVISIFLVMFNLAVGALSQENLLSFAVDMSGHERTFTGRTHMWAEIFDLTAEHPILGGGYSGFWVGGLSQEQAELWEELKWTPGQGHNGYVDVYVDLGLMGLLILACVIVSALRTTVSMLEVNLEYGVLRAVLLCIVLVANITESIFLRGSHLWLIFLLFAMSPFDTLSAANSKIADFSSGRRHDIFKQRERIRL